MGDQLLINRRTLLKLGAAGTAISASGLMLPTLARAEGPESQQVGEIYQLQAAFHRAKTTQDLDLMMSLWADAATFVNKSSGHTYIGSDQIRGFWQSSGSFTHHRFSLVPSFKTTIQVQGDEAFLYFECHDVGEFQTSSFGEPLTKTIVNDSYLAGALRHIQGSWVFWFMTAGSSSPLSYSTYYFPIP